MLKNIELMSYLETGKQVNNYFPNYYILNNVQTAHKQKAILHAMLRQQTDPKIMTRLFCKLAKQYEPDLYTDTFEADYLDRADGILI